MFLYLYIQFWYFGAYVVEGELMLFYKIQFWEKRDMRISDYLGAGALEKLCSWNPKFCYKVHNSSARIVITICIANCLFNIHLNIIFAFSRRSLTGFILIHNALCLFLPCVLQCPDTPSSSIW